MSLLHTGWTPSVSQEEKDRNEIKSVLDNLISNPNQYWENRFKALVEKSFEVKADQLHALARLDFNLFNTPHAVEEAYQMDKEEMNALRDYIDDYLDDGCGNDTADLLASMRG